VMKISSITPALQIYTFRDDLGAPHSLRVFKWYQEHSQQSHGFGRSQQDKINKIPSLMVGVHYEFDYQT
jgi:hypothetical protein